MRIIKVDATDSTNSYVRELYRENPNLENLCLWTNAQTKGRGQKGNTWQSEDGKNLTFSVFFQGLTLDVSEQFRLSAIASLTVYEVLLSIGIPNLQIKWPNDILADNFKIGGILIENFLRGSEIHATIIGLGLNVNQNMFNNLPKAASLTQLTGRHFDLDWLLNQFIGALEKKIQVLNHLSMTELLECYHEHLFAKDEIFTFELPNAQRFPGIVRGVDDDGRLIVQTDDGSKRFEVKEVRLLY